MGVPVPVICCLIAGGVVVLIFCGAFFVELFFPKKNEKGIKAIKEVQEVNDFDIDAMLSKLEEKTAKEEKVEEAEVIQPVIAKSVRDEKVVEEETKNDDIDFDALFKQLEEEAALIQKEEQEAVVEEEKKEEIKVQENAVQPEEVKPIVTGPNFDYNVRIQTIKDSLVRVEKDLAKATREVNKYEKTIARKERNEKLLDRKSAELTNLNLVLYSVNNIDDIDPEKKKKQEDLMEHITELKASISSADAFIAQNQEKYLNNKKIKDFLTGEKDRYIEEIAELEHLIEAGKKKNN